jgi:hypothetical protein
MSAPPAGAVYRLIARRLEPREAEIMRRMAEAESGHRARLEQRMRELGIETPDLAGVRVPLWLGLQARIAPIDRLLAAREAAGVGGGRSPQARLDRILGHRGGALYVIGLVLPT